MMKELWKPIINYNYKISNAGRVMNKFGRILKTLTNYNGYSVINIYNDSGMKQFRVSRLVAIYFVSNPEKKTQVNHKNGDKSDNRSSNLEWNTSLENITHAWKTGLTKTFGQGNGIAKLSEFQAIEILSLYSDGGTRHADIAKMYNVSPSAINYLLARKSWKHLTP